MRIGSPREMDARLSLVAIAGCLLCLGACQSGKGKPASAKKATSGENSQLIHKGAGKLLSKHDANETKVLADWSNQMSGHIRQGRLFTATMRVRERPEFALRWLWLVSSQASQRTNNKLMLRTVARIYDQQILSLPQVSQSGWLNALRWMDENPGAYHSYLERKKAFQAALEKDGNTARAYGKVISGLPGNLPKQLALAARAGWLLQGADSDGAQSAYWQTIATQPGADALLVMHAHLGLSQAAGGDQEHLLRATDAGISLAQRRIFPVRQWQHWQLMRKQIDGKMTVADQYLMDKQVLETLSAALGPDVQLVWQTDLRQWVTLQLDRAKNGAGLDGVTTVVLAHVGLKQLDSGNPQSALITLKNAELSSKNLALENEMKLHQARALAGMNQISGATGLLMPLIISDTPTGRSAMSALAVIKLQRDQLPQAVALWNKALNNTSLEAWPGRVQAQADLALAYLMQGYEQKGLDLLHLAQAAMKQVDPEVWLLSLENERAYYEQMGDHKQALHMQQQIASLEAN